MAGSVTISYSTVDVPYTAKELIKVEIDWTADSSDGSVPQTDFSGSDFVKILGRKCVLAVTDPGATAPTDQYDIEILDEYGVDVMGASLTNRNATASEQAIPLISSLYVPRLCAGTWTFKLTNNSVNSATGKCILYFEE